MRPEERLRGFPARKTASPAGTRVRRPPPGAENFKAFPARKAFVLRHIKLDPQWNKHFPGRKVIIVDKFKLDPQRNRHFSARKVIIVGKLRLDPQRFSYFPARKVLVLFNIRLVPQPIKSFCARKALDPGHILAAARGRTVAAAGWRNAGNKKAA